MKRAFVHRAVTEEADGDCIAAQHLVAHRGADGEWQSTPDDGIAAIERCGAVKDVHRAAAPPAAAFQLPIHFSPQRVHADATCQRLAVLAIGGHDRVLRLQRLDHGDRNGLLTVVEMHEPRIFSPWYNSKHFSSNRRIRSIAVSTWHTCAWSRCTLSFIVRPFPRVEGSPSGNPSTRAFNRRRMILSLRVRGRPGEKSISFGATAAPRRFRAWPSRSRRSASEGVNPAHAHRREAGDPVAPAGQAIPRRRRRHRHGQRAKLGQSHRWGSCNPAH